MSTSIHDWVAEQLDRGMRSRYWGEDGPITDDGEASFSIDEVAQALEAAQAWQGAAADVVRRMKEELAGRLEAEQASAFLKGNRLYRYRPKRTLRVIDPAALARYLGDDLAKVVRIDGGNLRVTGLRTVAEARDSDPDAVFDTFCSWEEGAAQVEVLPIDRAPKFLSDMTDGEVR